MNLNYYNVFEEAGYTIISNATELEAASNTERLLGIFSISNMAKWLDRNVYTDNGHLNILIEQADPESNHGFNLTSGMLQSWNKLCFASGYIEGTNPLRHVLFPH